VIRLHSITRSRAAGRVNDAARGAHERDESARHIAPAADVERDVEPESHQSNSHERNPRDTSRLFVDMEAREDFLVSAEEHAHDFARGCRDGENTARANEQAAETRAKAAETR
jgi:hypothetical protein